MPKNNPEDTAKMIEALVKKSQDRTFTKEDSMLLSRAFLDTVVALLGGDQLDPAFKESYTKLTNALSTLQNTIQPFYEKNEAGLYPALTSDGKNALLSAYRRSMDLISSLQNELKKGNSKDTPVFSEPFHQLFAYLNADVKLLSNVIMDGNANLPDVIYEARSFKMEAPKDIQFHVAKGALSQRIPLSYVDSFGKMHNGFFTQNYTYHAREQFNNVAKRIAKLYPDYADYFLAFTKLKDPDYNSPELLNASPRSLSQNAMDLLVHPTRYGLKAGAFNKYMREVTFSIACEDFQRICQEEKIESSLRLQYINGISDGDSAPARNTALSRMAGLLGVSHLVATSREMTIVKDGKEFKGHFMDAAPGTDLKNVRKGDPMDLYDISVYDNSPGLRQVAELQVLDYICGNTDRHKFNLTYLFDTTDKHNPKFAGIVGFDNDLSFGRQFTTGNDVPGNNGVCLNNIRTISKSMANQIASLEKETVSLVLKDLGLSEQQLNACILRLLKIQEKIIEGKKIKWKSPTETKPGCLHVLEDDAYLTLKVSDLATTRDGIESNRFADLSMVPIAARKRAQANLTNDVSAEQQAKKEERDIHKKKPEYFTKMAKVDALFDPATYKNYGKQFQALYDKLSATKTTFHGSHEQFDTMMLSLGNMISFCNKEVDILGFQSALDDLKENIQNYITYKQDHMNRFKTAQNRMNYAKELRDLTKDIKASFFKMMESQNEQDRLALNREAAENLQAEKNGKIDEFTNLKNLGLQIQKDIAPILTRKADLEKNEQNQKIKFISNVDKALDANTDMKVALIKAQRNLALNPNEQHFIDACNKHYEKYHNRSVLMQRDANNADVQTKLLKYGAQVQKIATAIDQQISNDALGVNYDLADTLHIFANKRHPNSIDATELITNLKTIMTNHNIDGNKQDKDSVLGQVNTLIQTHEQCFAQDEISAVEEYMIQNRASGMLNKLTFISREIKDVLAQPPIEKEAKAEKSADVAKDAPKIP